MSVVRQDEDVDEMEPICRGCGEMRDEPLIKHKCSAENEPLYRFDICACLCKRFDPGRDQ